MIIEPMIVTDKIGRSIVLRNAEDKESHGFNRGMKAHFQEAIIYCKR